MLSTAPAPVSVTAVLDGGTASFSSSPAEVSPSARSQGAAPSPTEHTPDASDNDAPGPSEATAPGESEALRRGVRAELVEILRGGPATKRRIADELNSDPNKPHVAQGPLETLLNALVEEGVGATLMLGDPLELHYRLTEAVATPAAVIDRRARILATIACNALSSVVPAELDDVATIEPKDLEGLTLDGVLELGATFLGFKSDASVVESDLAALVRSGVLVTVDDAASTLPPSPEASEDGDEEEEDERDDEDEDHERDDEDESATRRSAAPSASGDLRYVFAKGKLAEYLVKGGPALALQSLPDAVHVALQQPPAAEDRTAFERTAAKLLDEERDAHARTKGKLAKVYEWLRDKGIDTELLDGRLETALTSPARPAAPAGAKIVMRKKRVTTEKADVVRLLEELNELASEESLLPETVKDAQERARDIVKSAKDAAKRRGEELATLRQDKVAAAKQNEIVIERRCRAEHDFSTNTVRYIDLATDELFDMEPFAAGPLFAPKPGSSGPGHAPEARAAAGGSEGEPPPRGDHTPAAHPSTLDGAPGDQTATAASSAPAAPGFTRRADPPVDAAEAASRAAAGEKAAKAARIPRTGAKVAHTVQGFETHMTAVLRAAGQEGVPTTDLLPRVLAAAGLKETPRGVPALVVVAEKNLKANQLVQERDGRLFWVGSEEEAPAPAAPAKRKRSAKGSEAEAPGKPAAKAARGKRK